MFVMSNTHTHEENIQRLPRGILQYLISIFIGVRLLPILTTNYYVSTQLSFVIRNNRAKQGDDEVTLIKKYVHSCLFLFTSTLNIYTFFPLLLMRLRQLTHTHINGKLINIVKLCRYHCSKNLIEKESTNYTYTHTRDRNKSFIVELFTITYLLSFFF